MYLADNQPISARWGGANWITDFVTPENPTVQLTYDKLAGGQTDPDAVTQSLWYFVSHQPYVPLMGSTLRAVGETDHQKDTWFFPSEAITLAKGNCANKSFVLASLMKNYFKAPGQVYVVVGNLHMGEIGAHAWVELNDASGSYIVETTQPNVEKYLIPTSLATAYEPKVYFDETSVFTAYYDTDVVDTLDQHFGVCAIPFLKDYLCEKCLSLEGA